MSDIISASLSAVSQDVLSLTLDVPFAVNPAGIKIRMAGTKEVPLWCLADVCLILGKTTSSAVADALAALDPDEKVMETVHTPGGPQKMAFVNEPGLYRTIITTRLKKTDEPELLERNRRVTEFRRWVFHDVLPCIRKHGCYPIPVERIGDSDNTMAVRQLLAVCERQDALAREQTELAVVLGDARSRVPERRYPDRRCGRKSRVQAAREVNSR